MKRLVPPASFVLLLGAALAWAPPEQEGEHPSLASRVLATYTPAPPAERTPAAMAEAARGFLGALSDELRAACALPLDHEERRNWTNVPPRASERGARLGDLDETQMRRACDLLATVLSPQGYAKARDVMLADDRLLPGGRTRVGFGAENYWLVLFGNPSATERWALQLDGHHIAINLTFEGERMTMSPTFIGTQPAEFERGETRVTPLKGVVASAFALAGSLTDEQRGRAVVRARRGQIAAGAGRDGFVPEPVGLPCAELSTEQRELLIRLLAAFLGDLPEPHAGRRLTTLEAEIDAMVFAWNGPTASPADVSWRVQGPTVIVEYACQDLGGDPLDHLHSMYRDPTNEYGEGFGGK